MAVAAAAAAVLPAPEPQTAVRRTLEVPQVAEVAWTTERPPEDLLLAAKEDQYTDRQTEQRGAR